MATFRVGQRVKVVRSCKPEDMPPPDRCHWNPGCNTGVLVSRLTVSQIIFGGGDWLMRLDNGIEGTVHAYQLEPIQPERNQVISWAECKEWQPEHLREVVS